MFAIELLMPVQGDIECCNHALTMAPKFMNAHHQCFLVFVSPKVRAGIWYMDHKIGLRHTTNMSSLLPVNTGVWPQAPFTGA